MPLVHHNLVAWQRADDLYIDVHRLTLQHFPAFERYELGAQVRRAAYSVPANIVEGIARQYPREAVRFFYIAVASLNELGYGLHAASRLGYIELPECEALERRIAMVAGPLRGLIRRYRHRGPLQASAARDP